MSIFNFQFANFGRRSGGSAGGPATNPPVNTVAPAISGVTNVGVTLVVSNGTWTGAVPISYGYQWYRNNVAISGATAATYTLTADDLGASIAAAVLASNVDGNAAAGAANVGPVAIGSIAPVANIVIPSTATDTIAPTASVSPITTSSDTIPIDVDGFGVQINTSGGQSIADATKMVVNLARAGYSTIIGSAVNNNNLDVAYGTKLLRRISPNNGSGAGNALLANGSAFLIGVDNLIHASDIITSIVLRAGFFTGQTTDIVVPTASITRNDTIVYDKPIVRPITLPFRRATTSIDVEFAAGAAWATAGQQVARVEATWKRSGSYGTWAGSNTMVRSAATPSSGRAPSGIAAPIFRVTVDLTGCADSVTRGDTIIVYRGYSFFGDRIFDSEVDGSPLQSDGRPSSLSPPSGLPIIKDVAGNHSPIYAWVNQDGTAGASAAIRTDTTDPGSGAGSFASEAAAFAAARTWNNTAGNRPAPHNTTSGLVILYRDVPGSGLGDNATAYWQRASMSGFSDGLVPPVLCSATYLSTGAPNVNCRRRGVQADGTTAATSKVFTGIIELRGLTLDSTGLTGASHTILDGQGGGASTSGAAAATTGVILNDTTIRENAAAGSNPAIFRAGWRWDWRVEQSNPPTSACMGNAPANWAGMLMSAGSWYWNSSYATVALAPACLVGVQCDNMNIIGLAAGAAPDIANALLVHVRLDAENPTQSPVQLANSIRPTNGLGIVGLLVRKVGTNSSPAIQISADAQLNTVSNFFIWYGGADAGGDGANDNDRINWLYGDQAFIQLLKRGLMGFCAWGSVNIKDDTFAAPEVLGSGGYTTGWVASTRYTRGAIRHDNNATPASRIWYQAVGADFTSGATQATDLADTSRWLSLGAINGQAFGAQPRRTGNWRAQHAVRCFGNVAARTANNDTGFTVSSWAGEVPWRGGAFLAADSTARAKYWKNRTGGTLSTFANRGDYRPQSLAAGDANDSPLLNRVPAGLAVMPFDLAGNPRRNDGTGAAGPYERSA